MLYHVAPSEEVSGASTDADRADALIAMASVTSVYTAVDRRIIGDTVRGESGMCAGCAGKRLDLQECRSQTDYDGRRASRPPQVFLTSLLTIYLHDKLTE